MEEDEVVVEEQTPTKVCPRCSTQAETSESFCAHCGAPYERKRRRPSRRTKLIVAVILGALALAGVGAGVYAKVQHDQDVKEQRARAARIAAERKRAQDAREARERARVKAAAEADSFELSLRRSTVKELQASISKDARGRVRDGILDGPILGTTCDPAAGSNPTDLDEKTSEFTCLASTEKSSDGTRRGYGFIATIDWDDYSYTWQLDI